MISDRPDKSFPSKNCCQWQWLTFRFPVRKSSESNKKLCQSSVLNYLLVKRDDTFNFDFWPSTFDFSLLTFDLRLLTFDLDYWLSTLTLTLGLGPWLSTFNPDFWINIRLRLLSLWRSSLTRELFFLLLVRFRVVCYKIATNTYFVNFILCLIIVSSILLAAEDPLNASAKRNQVRWQKSRWLRRMWLEQCTCNPKILGVSPRSDSLIAEWFASYQLRFSTISCFILMICLA